MKIYNKVETFTAAILVKMSEINKWQRDFLVHLFGLFMSLRGRYTFLNFSRYGLYNEATYRKHYGKGFDFATFNSLLIEQMTLKERIWTFDASYISKSGKKTQGLGKYWSGCAGMMKRGLELTSLAMVDVVNHTALHYKAQQTLFDKLTSPCATLLDYYAQIITQQAADLLKLSRFLVVDAYFTKQPFVEAVCTAGLTLIGRLRDDMVLYYQYTAVKVKGRGRQKKYGKKVDTANLSEAHFTLCLKEADFQVWEGRVWVKAFKKWVKVAIYQELDEKGQVKTDKKPKIYFSTDPTLSGADVYIYYTLRYQMEFLYRDGKQYTGLEQCQSTQSDKLEFQFNMSLSAISVAKAVHHLNQPLENRLPFSMADIKTQYFNELMLDKFFNVFQIDPNTKEIQQKLNVLRDFGKIAA